MRLKDNFFKVIVLIVAIIFSNKCISQKKDSLKLAHTFKQYQESLYASFQYYTDSVSKRAKTRWIVIKVYIADFDTSAQKLKMSLDFSWSDPIPYFNPTHIKEWKDRIYLIRFGKNVSKETIKRFDFQIITPKRIADLKKLEKIKLNGIITTGEPESLVFKINQDTISKTWYPNPMSMPVDAEIHDYDYVHGHIEYEAYLKKKLKEYGY
jgi:hypothetical protein